MRNYVFQASAGKFTVAFSARNGRAKAAFALCNAKDQFVRRTGFDKASGRLLAKSMNTEHLVYDLGSYSGQDFYGEVVKPAFQVLAQLNTKAFTLRKGRVGDLRLALAGSLKLAQAVT